MKLPYMTPMAYSGLYRVSDIAVADIVINLNNEEIGNKIVTEITKRNSKVITVRNFTYDGINYDVMYQPKEVARLYSEICGES